MSDIYNLGSISGFVFTNLFDGSADTNNTTYTLNDDISKYKFLVVYSCVSNSAYSTSNRNYTLIDIGSMNRGVNEYNIYMNNASTSENGVWYRISFYFPNDTTFKISALTVSGSWANPKIYKIIGIN